MKQKRLTQEQLEKYENKKLTSKEIIQMEERGFKIPLILKLNALQEDKISFTEDTVRDMLEFAVEREYYEKAALLHTYLESNTSSN